jgi:DNA-binding NtrC family response regulator
MKKQKKIALLIVGRNCAEALTEILQHCGADVMLAKNCREARAALGRFPVDIVVSEPLTTGRGGPTGKHGRTPAFEQIRDAPSAKNRRWR